jgi:hypothetical protein
MVKTELIGYLEHEIEDLVYNRFIHVDCKQTLCRKIIFLRKMKEALQMDNEYQYEKLKKKYKFEDDEYQAKIRNLK